MNFEELQQSWQSQPIEKSALDPALKERITTDWRKQQRRTMWRNIGTTIAFIAVFINFGWVYHSFHAGHTFFFSGSLLLMSLLMLVYLWVLWRGLAYKKDDPAVSSVLYLDHYLQKLYWQRKTITSFTWIYSILLWLALMFYCIDVTRGGSMLLRIGAPLITTLYIFGMQVLVTRKSREKQLKRIDQLIADMQELKEGISK